MKNINEEKIKTAIGIVFITISLIILFVKCIETQNGFIIAIPIIVSLGAIPGMILLVYALNKEEKEAQSEERSRVNKQGKITVNNSHTFNPNQFKYWHEEVDPMKNFILVDEEVRIIFDNNSEPLKKTLIFPVSESKELSKFLTTNCVYFENVEIKAFKEYYDDVYSQYDKYGHYQTLRIADLFFGVFNNSYFNRDNKSREVLLKSDEYNQLEIYKGSRLGIPAYKNTNLSVQTSLVNLLKDDNVYLKEKFIFEDEKRTQFYEKKFRQRFRKGIKSSAAYKDYLLKTITSKYMCCVPSDKSPGYEYNPVKRLYYSGKIGAENVYEEYAVKEFEMLGV